MALYEYLAISKNGKKFREIINAESIDEAKAFLLGNSIVVFKIAPIKHKQRPLSKSEVLDFFLQLENLLKAGIPLYESLVIMSQKNDKRKIKILILDLCEKIKMGFSLSEAMRQHFKTFDLVICSMIENAQKTARMEESINEIINILNSSIRLKKKLISAFTYPLILFIFCFAVLSFLLFFTIPTLYDLFEGRQLHPFTKAVFFASKTVCKYKLFFLIFILLIIALIAFAILNDKFRKKIYEKIIVLPFLANFMIKVSLIRFCISFSNLLKGGESYVNSLCLAIGVLNHPVLEKEMNALKDKLIEGKELSELLKSIECIPEEMPKMLSIAEQTSQMPNMLINIARIHEEEVEKFLSKISSIIQPVMLILLGIIVGFVVLSILIPLTDVSSFLGD
ncbi:MAG: type II secretion system F family protein [Parachlamydiales bacterium]|jgi:general secretion pathway protein F/type IV pilus assembly protein PilC